MVARVLTDTGNAIRTSEEELQLAVSEFRVAETEPFTRALEAAKKVAASFALRQRLDDDIPETDSERRSCWSRSSPPAPPRRQ